MSMQQTAAGSPSGLGTPVVHCPAGAIRGTARHGLTIFKGIPYALPPVGPALWTPPVAAPVWAGIRDATKFGPACVQPPRKPGSLFADTLPGESEDCLSLNIWAPESAQNAPVLVWLHGGSLTWGAGSEILYDGEILATHGIVVVTINYRLGVFGYLAHPELSAESPDGISGNYGLLDQIAALKWIKRNIAAFGGNPDNVTIAGESAGALSVMYLMASPMARGLFAKAIAQSAYMKSTPELREGRFGEIPAEQAGVELAAKLGAVSLKALRNMDAAALAEAAQQAGFAAEGTIDGHVLPRQLVDIFDLGEQAPVPVLTGFNCGEASIFPFMLPPLPDSAAAYEAEMRARNGDLADALLTLYPSDDPRTSLLSIARDAVYGWTAERLAVKQSALGMPAFLYYFDHGYPETDVANLHAFHGSELPFLFGTHDKTPPRWPNANGRPPDNAISEAIAGYWTSFAKSGVPVAKDQPDWQPYGRDRAYMHFAEAPCGGNNLSPGMYRQHEEDVRRRRTAGNTAWNWNFGIAAPTRPTET